MKKCFLFIVLITISICGMAQFTWTQRADLPGADRFVGASFSINGKGYFGLGESSTGTYLNDFWEYDPATNVWTAKANFPGAGRYAPTSFAINGKGYVCMGLDNSGNKYKDVWEYNPLTNTWVQKSDFDSVARYGASCFVIGDTAYVGTGSYGNPSDYLTDLWMYVPATDTWTVRAPFPGGNRLHATAFSIGHFGYLGIGTAGGTDLKNDFYKYDPATDSWSAITNYPYFLLGAGSFVIGGTGYVGTGFDQSTNNNLFYSYQPALNAWVPVNTPTSADGRRGMLTFVIGGIGYFGTGHSDIGYLGDLWASGRLSDIEPVSDESTFVISPNPAGDHVNIAMTNSAGNFEIELYDNSGRLIIEQQGSELVTTLDISDLACGVYFVKLKTCESVFVKKMIRE